MMPDLDFDVCSYGWSIYFIPSLPVPGISDHHLVSLGDHDHRWACCWAVLVVTAVLVTLLSVALPQLTWAFSHSQGFSFHLPALLAVFSIFPLKQTFTSSFPPLLSPLPLMQLPWHSGFFHS